MKFKNHLLVSLVVVGLFLSISNQVNAKTSQNILEISYDKSDYKKEWKTLNLSYLSVKLFGESKLANQEIEKLKRKPFNKKVYRKIKRFLKKKKIRRKRRIIVQNKNSNQLQNQIG